MILTHHGINSLLTDDFVDLNGRKYLNRFYKDENDIVQSTLKDAVVLPSGYEKLDFIYNKTVSTSDTNPIIETNFQLFTSFGSIFLSWENTDVAITSYSPIFRSTYINENTNITRLIHSAASTSNFIVNVNAAARVGSTALSSPPNAWKISDTRKLEELAGPRTLTVKTSQGSTQTSFRLYLLGKGAADKLHFFFVVDNDGVVTFTAIPARNGSSYGFYDLVSGTFYTDENLGV